MAQKRLRDYQEPLGSFDHNLINLGVHFPGRFAGYDTFTRTGGLTFKVNHITKGVRLLDDTGNPLGPYGVAMTNQGVIVIEDQDILGAIETNAGNNFIRKDLLVMTHQYVDIAGGLPAIYEVVRGAFGSQTFGVLSPNQTVIGILTIPALAADTGGTNYQKAPNPDSGDTADAKLEGDNAFQGTQEFKQSTFPTFIPVGPTDLTGINGSQSKKWDLGGPNFGGNTFNLFPNVNTELALMRVYESVNQNGMEVNIFTKDTLVLMHGTPPSPAEIAAGYGGIQIDDRFRDPVTNTFKAGVAGATVLYTFKRLNGSWFLINVAGVGYLTAAGATVDTAPKIKAWGKNTIGDVPPGGNATYTIDFSSFGLNFADTTQYSIVGSIQQRPGGNLSDTIAWAIVNQMATSFQVSMGEIAGVVQNVDFNWFLISTPH